MTGTKLVKNSQTAKYQSVKNLEGPLEFATGNGHWEWSGKFSALHGIVEQDESVGQGTPFPKLRIEGVC